MASKNFEKICRVDTSLAILDDLWHNIHKAHDQRHMQEYEYEKLFHDMCVTMDWLSEHLLNGGTLSYLKHKHEGEDI